MARDMSPVLKRCRSLGLDPVYMGLNKKSKRKTNTGKKQSEYGLQLKAEGKICIRRFGEAFPQQFRKGEESKVRDSRREFNDSPGVKAG